MQPQSHIIMQKITCAEATILCEKYRSYIKINLKKAKTLNLSIKC